MLTKEEIQKRIEDGQGVYVVRPHETSIAYLSKSTKIIYKSHHIEVVNWKAHWLRRSFRCEK